MAIPRLIVAIMACSIVVHSASAFGVTDPSSSSAVSNNADNNNMSTQRRNFLQSTAAITLASWTGGLPSALADDDAATATATATTAVILEEVPMKTFVDTANPSLFVINVPQRFFSIRRSFKGDLPDPKTGKGRRGGAIFSSGDMSKAEVIAVERFPVRNFLEEEGYQPTGDLTTFSSIGDPTAIAALLLRRREQDKPGTVNQGVLNKDSVSVSPDGQTLRYSSKQEINVMKPELLMEEIGLSQLFRTTVAKATLQSNDGNIVAVFASALDQDFAGPDGVAIVKAVDSFLATDQSGK